MTQVSSDIKLKKGSPEFEQWLKVYETKIGHQVTLAQYEWAKTVWEASKAEERERCANLLEREIKRNDWFAGSAPYEIVLEQIRKGE